MEMIEKIKAILAEDSLLITRNREKVDHYNKMMSVGILYIFSIILLFPIVTAVFMEGFSSRIIISSVALFSTAITLCYFKKGNFDNCITVGLYITVTISATLAVLFSVITFPEHRATVLIGVFCIAPMAYLDKILRKTSYMLVIYIVHLILAIFSKDVSIYVIDASNTLCFLTVGCFLGYMVQKTKLDSFELEKRLVFERETDILTGLKNRRKMFEMLVEIEANEIERPTCAALLDIDFFKQYNDSYGHTVGDDFLRTFGKTLLYFEKEYNIKCFRYGGEEFSAILWGYNQQEQQNILEKLRIAVKEMDIQNGRTVSIGYVDWEKKQELDLENALILADAALYHAKHTGRDKVVQYNESIVV